jgi:hypothetical protein
MPTPTTMQGTLKWVPCIVKAIPNIQDELLVISPEPRAQPLQVRRVRAPRRNR